MEYLKDKKWNGKMHNLENNEIYELKDGKGFIKEYDYDGILIFEGEYLNGEKWNGKGKKYDNCRDLYSEVEYLNGKKKESDENDENNKAKYP